MEMQPFITPLIGFLGTIAGIFINKYWSKNPDTVNYQTTIIKDLYTELGRVKEKTEKLIETINRYESEKKELLSRINHLEQENRKQAHEIKELRRRLNEKPSKNV
jgi:peptidoglycan hydrolase CwlO-like protein